MRTETASSVRSTALDDLAGKPVSLTRSFRELTVIKPVEPRNVHRANMTQLLRKPEALSRNNTKYIGADGKCRKSRSSEVFARRVVSTFQLLYGSPVYTKILCLYAEKKLHRWIVRSPFYYEIQSSEGTFIPYSYNNLHKG